MGRIMAIDYGTKRIGLAVTDNLKMIATSLTTVLVNDLMIFLEAYLLKEEVECFVLGRPMNLDNTESEMEKNVLSLIEALRRKFPLIKIERMDERFTSKMAAQTILAAGIKKMDRRDKSLVDRVSATIILQSYLEQQSNL